MTTQTTSGRIQAHIEALSSLRRFFKAMLSGELDASARTFQTGSCRSHIHWLVGHMTHVMDGVAHGSFGAPAKMSAEHNVLFGMGATPDPDAAGYPTLESLMRDFDAATASVIKGLESMSDEDLNAPLPDASPVKAMFPSLGDLLHGLHFHTAYHLGQVSMLRRAQGLPSGMGM